MSTSETQPVSKVEPTELVTFKGRKSDIAALRLASQATGVPLREHIVEGIKARNDELYAQPGVKEAIERHQGEQQALYSGFDEQALDTHFAEQEAAHQLPEGAEPLSPRSQE